MPKGQRAERAQSQLQEGAEATLSRANEVWIESQATFFEHFDEVARRWLDRRREALDAARQSIEDMRQTSDIGEVFRIQQEWVLGSVRRLSADLSELSGAVVNLVQGAASQLGRMSEGSIQQGERSSRELLSTAGSKPRSDD